MVQKKTYPQGLKSGTFVKFMLIKLQRNFFTKSV